MQSRVYSNKCSFTSNLCSKWVIFSIVFWAWDDSRSGRLRQRLGVGYQTVINEALLKLSSPVLGGYANAQE